jgi:hypothetical protein
MYLFTNFSIESKKTFTRWNHIFNKIGEKNESGYRLGILSIRGANKGIRG